MRAEIDAEHLTGRANLLSQIEGRDAMARGHIENGCAWKYVEVPQ
jgi:hypothetical protein